MTLYKFLLHLIKRVIFFALLRIHLVEVLGISYSSYFISRHKGVIHLVQNTLGWLSKVLGTFLLLDTCHFVLILLGNLIHFVLIVLGYLISRDKGVIYLVENTLG